MTQIPQFFGPRQPSSSRRGVHALALWRSRDGVNVPATIGTPITLSCTSQNARNYIKDSLGRYFQTAIYQPSICYRDLDLDTVCEVPVLRTTTSRNNCPYSEDFTNWTAVNAPSILTPTINLGQVVLSLLSDDSGTLQEHYETTALTTGLQDGVECLSFFIAKGNINAAAGAGIRVFDFTATLTKLELRWTWAADAGGRQAPTITTVIGKVLSKEYCGRHTYLHQTTNLLTSVDVWRIVARTNLTYVNANSNRIRVFPADTAAQQGNEFFGGIQLHDHPSGYFKNPGATSVFSDSNAWSMAFNPVPMAMTFAVRFVYTGGPETFPSAQGGSILQITGAGGGNPSVSIYSSDALGGDFYGAGMHNGTTSITVYHNVTPNADDIVTLRLSMRGDGQLVLGQSLNDGPEVTVTSGNPPGLPAAWISGASMRLNQNSNGGEDYLAAGAFAGEPSMARIISVMK